MDCGVKALRNNGLELWKWERVLFWKMLILGMLVYHVFVCFESNGFEFLFRFWDVYSDGGVNDFGFGLMMMKEGVYDYWWRWHW